MFYKTPRNYTIPLYPSSRPRKEYRVNNTQEFFISNLAIWQGVKLDRDVNLQEWTRLVDYPDYMINRSGEIFNIRTQRYMRRSMTMQGNAKIGLMSPRGRKTLSVARLVAQTFIPQPSPICDAVIVLNGDMNDLRVENLAWRPDWFAWKYTRQLREPAPNYCTHLKIRDALTWEEFENIVHAATTHGLLFMDVWRSTYTGSPVYPINHAFEVLS